MRYNLRNKFTSLVLMMGLIATATALDAASEVAQGTALSNAASLYALAAEEVPADDEAQATCCGDDGAGRVAANSAGVDEDATQAAAIEYVEVTIARAIVEAA